MLRGGKCSTASFLDSYVGSGVGYLVVRSIRTG